ncbi:MAG: hypothetical protein LQ350_002799 [Teloschistes chrysophthalmus]|nr:MAG: hypothetical protein LQ350_002799 [Niorma chrysophthalma]
MPPKCCTADHIPLNHVEKLFDTKFKMKWNAKYQEYTTKNRLYCPRRGCGEWIKPKDIHVIDSLVGDKKRRKHGKCSRCRTNVCAACNGRWHASPKCPEANDKATQQFIEIAKKEGWQRCYNCSATVELKEGCNHMTCRCLAEFCMMCGVKWKGCDCPWFSYQTIEQDRLNRMNVPVNPRVVVVNGQQLDADHPRAARGYQAELVARREQERLDEQLARRLQTLGLHEPPGVDFYQVHDDHDERVDAGFGVGNTGGHHMNTNYVSFHASRPANPPPAPPPAPPRQPLLRQHSRASRAFNSLPSTRAAERVVPRRSATDYYHEAVVHAPLQIPNVGVGMPIGDDSGIRGSVLAGLTRDSSTGEGRVEEWRRYVDSIS